MDQLSIAARRRRNRNALQILGDIQSGHNGDLTFSVNIQPELLDKVMGFVKTFTMELRRSMHTRDFWREESRREFLSSETNRISAITEKRVALSVYNKTGSITLAAKAGGWKINDVRMFIQDAKVFGNKKKKKRRNARICRLKEAGLSCRDIAAVVDVGAGQISRIVNGK